MRDLLRSIFNDDFAQIRDGATWRAQFFARNLTLADLAQVSRAVCASHADLGDISIPAALLIKGKYRSAPFIILSQLHGNEPAGLAGILLAMALASAGLLERDVLAMVGNPIAATQYFAAWEKAPQARQETRDAFRGGVDTSGKLLPDMNRIPVDFRTRAPSDAHIKRAQELVAAGERACGITDIHSARGSMLCITDHKRDADLKHSSIRNVLVGLADAISANASKTVTVQTLKTILSPLDNIKCQIGIEAGRHESLETPHNAASFTLSLLHTLGLTSVPPLFDKENGVFQRYQVQPRITYADLTHEPLNAGDGVYMAKTCHALASVPERSGTVIIKKAGGDYALQSVSEFTRHPAGQMEFAVYQYDEMEAIAAGEVVAVAVPSGAMFKTKKAFSGIFVSKSAMLYDKDPTVGPWPVAARDIANIKFCYPCDVGEMKITF